MQLRYGDSYPAEFLDAPLVGHVQVAVEICPDAVNEGHELAWCIPFLAPARQQFAIRAEDADALVRFADVDDAGLVEDDIHFNLTRPASGL